MAHSSISFGTVRKYPMRSHVQKGTRNVGYVTTSDHRLSESPRRFTTVLSGRKSSDGGTRYVTKIATPNDAAPRKRRRASGYAARMPITTEMMVAPRLTIRLFTNQLQKSVSDESSW